MKPIEEKKAHKDYHAPKLQDYGNIQQITAADTGAKGADAVRGSRKT